MLKELYSAEELFASISDNLSLLQKLSFLYIQKCSFNSFLKFFHMVVLII